VTHHPEPRKIFEGVASRHDFYAMMNRHSQAPFDEARRSGRLYAGEWFEISETDHDRMFDILPPLFMRGDHFAMGEFLAAQVTSVFLSLKIDKRFRWFHAYCDLADAGSINHMRAAIVERESRPLRAMSKSEKLEHIWSITAPDFRAYADQRFAAGLAGRRIVLMFTAAQARAWKLLDDLTDEEVAASFPFRSGTSLSPSPPERSVPPTPPNPHPSRTQAARAAGSRASIRERTFPWHMTIPFTLDLFGNTVLSSGFDLAAPPPAADLHRQ
jgi:hypothetical protein